MQHSLGPMLESVQAEGSASLQQALKGQVSSWDDPTPRNGHGSGHAAGTKPLAGDEGREPTPKCLCRKRVRCNTRTAHTYHAPSLPAVPVFWKESRIHPLSALAVLSPSAAPGPRGESVSDRSRLSGNGLRRGEADSRSQRDNITQHGYAAVYQQPAAKSLLLLFIFK